LTSGLAIFQCGIIILLLCTLLLWFTNRRKH
jgi:hypothetical protein